MIKITLQDIETFFNNYDYSINQVKINDAETIVDLKKFVKVNIEQQKANSGNKRFLPYFDALKKAYLIVNKL